MLSELPDMTIRQERPTLEEFLLWPEQKPYLEYIHGEVRSKAVPDPFHSLLQVRLAAALYGWTERNTGWTLTEQRCILRVDDEFETVLPDVAWWSQEQLPSLPEGPLRPPSLAVEILSPDDRFGDTQDKILIYLKSGVEVVWIFDPRSRKVTVYRAQGLPQVLSPPADLRCPVMRGFTLSLAALFAGIPFGETSQPPVEC